MPKLRCSALLLALFRILTPLPRLTHCCCLMPCGAGFLLRAGTLIDGTEFDSSYKRGEPTTFAPNQVSRSKADQGALAVRGSSKAGQKLLGFAGVFMRRKSSFVLQEKLQSFTLLFHVVLPVPHPLQC